MNGTVDEVSVLIYIRLVSFLPPKDITNFNKLFSFVVYNSKCFIDKSILCIKENNIVLHLPYFRKTVFDLLHSARKPGSDGMFFLLSPVSTSH